MQYARIAAAKVAGMRWFFVPCVLLSACYVAHVPPTPLAPDLPVATQLTQVPLSPRASEAPFAFLGADAATLTEFYLAGLAAQPLSIDNPTATANTRPRRIQPQ